MVAARSIPIFPSCKNPCNASIVVQEAGTGCKYPSRAMPALVTAGVREVGTISMSDSSREHCVGKSEGGEGGVTNALLKE